MKQTKNFNKKRTIACLLSLVLVFGLFISAAISVNAEEYKLVWSDEFDGNGVNPYNWSLDTGVRNGERQTYTLNNAKTENGKLIIKGECTVIDENGNVMPAGQVSNNTKDVKSASLQSVGKQAFKFGKVEIRAKLPNACSSWPAFWTCGWDKYGMDAGQGGSNWPCNGEIDFMEMMCVNSLNETKSPWGKTNTDKEYGVHLHTGPKFIKSTGEYYDGYAEGTRGYADYPIDPGNVYDSKQLASDWHTYGMIWERNSIKITFDGAVKITIDTSNAALLKKAEGKAYYNAYKSMLEQYGNPFNDYEHYFLLNFAIGGSGTEYRFYSDEWPQNLAIDYIRVYQKNDGISTHNATIKAGTTYNVNGKTYTTYNHWAGKGLTKGSEIASNWVADPQYGGQKVTETDTIPTDTPVASTSSSGSTATTATTAATAPTTSSSGSQTGGKIIDWDVNTNYYAEGSTLTKGTDSITAVKASGTNLITSQNNDLTAYSGIKFTATPNSGNEKTTVLLKVDDVPWRFTLGSGATECLVTFAEMGVTPKTTSKVYFGAEGGTATNITFSDVYGITSGSSSTTTTTAKPTTTTTTTTTAKPTTTTTTTTTAKPTTTTTTTTAAATTTTTKAATTTTTQPTSDATNPNPSTEKVEILTFDTTGRNYTNCWGQAMGWTGGTSNGNGANMKNGLVSSSNGNLIISTGDEGANMIQQQLWGDQSTNAQNVYKAAIAAMGTSTTGKKYEFTITNKADNTAKFGFKIFTAGDIANFDYNTNDTQFEIAPGASKTMTLDLPAGKTFASTVTSNGTTTDGYLSFEFNAVCSAWNQGKINLEVSPIYLVGEGGSIVTTTTTTTTTAKATTVQPTSTATTQITSTGKTNPQPPTQTTTNNSNSKLGDLDLDGSINIFDLLIMKKIVGSPDSDYAKSYQANADLNKDNTVNISDLLIIKKQVAKA